jgi:acyl carrier protein
MVKSLAELEKLFEIGQLKALPKTSFPLTQIKSAFQYFQKSLHIGKVVLEIPESPESPSTKIFHPESCYMVTGGLGGLGLKVVNFIVENGGNVVVVGRNPANEETLRKLKPIAEHVTLLQGDVGDYEQCQNILREIKRPLKGIFHCAGVFSNGFIINQSIESFSKVYQPKVYGTWNLHSLTMTMDLDYFVVFSSIASLMGSTGLSNYTGANRYMDSLIAYRVEQLGLKGTSINWGPWDEVGAVAGYIIGLFKNFYHFSPEIGILSLERALRLGIRQIAIADMDPSLWETMPKMRPLLSEFNISKSNRARSGENSGGVKGNPVLDGRLESMAKEVLSAEEVGDRLIKMEALVEACFRIHAGLDEGDSVDKDQPLSLMGMDSLIGMEMRTRLSKLLNIPIPNNSIQEHNSVKQFSKFLNDSLSDGIPAEVPKSEPEPDVKVTSEVLAVAVDKKSEVKQEKKLKPISKFFSRKLQKFNLNDKTTKSSELEGKKKQVK